MNNNKVLLPQCVRSVNKLVWIYHDTSIVDVRVLTNWPSMCQDPPSYSGFSGVNSMFASLTMICSPLFPYSFSRLNLGGVARGEKGPRGSGRTTCSVSLPFESLPSASGPPSASFIFSVCEEVTAWGNFFTCLYSTRSWCLWVGFRRGANVKSHSGMHASIAFSMRLYNTFSSEGWRLLI